mmetsp:Transcript_101261/g.216878  ORF Transcript_101261/g.216878 Transcript_101261/m.216878 type:complete len:250 (-) Transcript_101261:329-1078(-)
MRVARQALAPHLLAEVHNLLQAQAALQVRTCVGARRGVALDIELVAHASACTLATEEVVHSDLPDVGDGSEGTNVAADTRGALVAITDHNGRVPAHKVGYPLLHGEVARIGGLHAGRDRVAHRSGDRGRDPHALPHRLVHELVQQEACPPRPVMLQHCIERLDPLVRLLRIKSRQRRPHARHGRGVVTTILVHEGQRCCEVGHLSAECLREFAVGDVPALGEIREELRLFLRLERQPDRGHQAGELAAV